MSEHIEREMLINLLLPMAEASAKLHDGIMTAVFQVKNQPAADVAPVVHGHWRISEYEFLDCSCCGKSYYTGATSTSQANDYIISGKCYKFCPNCGAKMDGEEKPNEENM